MLCIGKPSLRCEQRARPKLNKPSRFALALRSGLRKGRTFLGISKIMHEIFTYREWRERFGVCVTMGGKAGGCITEKEWRLCQAFSGQRGLLRKRSWCEIPLDWASVRCCCRNACAGRQKGREEGKRKGKKCVSLPFIFPPLPPGTVPFLFSYLYKYFLSVEF